MNVHHHHMTFRSRKNHIDVYDIVQIPERETEIHPEFHQIGASETMIELDRHPRCTRHEQREIRTLRKFGYGRIP